MEWNYTTDSLHRDVRRIREENIEKWDRAKEKAKQRGSREVDDFARQVDRSNFMRND